jgi:hypothetical protein
VRKGNTLNIWVHIDIQAVKTINRQLNLKSNAGGYQGLCSSRNDPNSRSNGTGQLLYQITRYVASAMKPQMNSTSQPQQ